VPIVADGTSGDRLGAMLLGAMRLSLSSEPIKKATRRRPASPQALSHEPE
jgi:hypothetical protein